MSDQNKPATMADSHLTELLLALEPLDGSPIGNTALKRALETRLTRVEGQALEEEAYWQAHATLVAQGLLVKGQGRGGSVRRAAVLVSDMGGDLADGEDEPALVLDVVLHHARHAMHSEPIGEGVLVAEPNQPAAIDDSRADSDEQQV